jgi:hypothetical protein
VLLEPGILCAILKEGKDLSFAGDNNDAAAKAEEEEEEEEEEETSISEEEEKEKKNEPTNSAFIPTAADTTVDEPYESLSEAQGLNSSQDVENAMRTFLQARGLALNENTSATDVMMQQMQQRKKNRKGQITPAFPRTNPNPIPPRVSTPKLACAACKTEYDEVVDPETDKPRLMKCSGGCKGHYLCNELCRDNDLHLNRHYLVCPGYQTMMKATKPQAVAAAATGKI